MKVWQLMLFTSALLKIFRIFKSKMQFIAELQMSGGKDGCHLINGADVPGCVWAASASVHV